MFNSSVRIMITANHGIKNHDYSIIDFSMSWSWDHKENYNSRDHDHKTMKHFWLSTWLIIFTVGRTWSFDILRFEPVDHDPMIWTIKFQDPDQKSGSFFFDPDQKRHFFNLDHKLTFFLILILVISFWSSSKKLCSFLDPNHFFFDPD